MTKLNPLNEWLWQRPKKTVSPFDTVWYENQVLGHNTLGDMMATISRDAKLSRIYTNHCIKVTPPSLLDSILYETLSDGSAITTDRALPATTMTTRQTRQASVVPILPATSKPLLQIPVTSSLLNSNQAITVTIPGHPTATVSSVSQNNNLLPVVTATHAAGDNQSGTSLSSVLNQVTPIITSNQQPQALPVCLGYTVSASAPQSVLMSSGIQTTQPNSIAATMTPIQSQPFQFALPNQNQAASTTSFLTPQSIATAMPVNSQPLIMASNMNQTLSAMQSNQNGQSINLGVPEQFLSTNQNQPLMVMAPNTNKAFALVPIDPQQMLAMVR